MHSSAPSSTSTSTRRTSFPDLSLHLTDDTPDETHDENYAVETTHHTNTNHQRQDSTMSIDSNASIGTPTNTNTNTNKPPPPPRATSPSSSSSTPKPKLDPRDHVLTLCPVKSFGTPPPSMCGHTATLVPHTYCMILIGGADQENIMSDTYVFHIGSQQWERIHIKGSAPSPGALFGHSATLIGRKIYVFGGVTYASTYEFDDKRTASPHEQDDEPETDGKGSRRRRFGNTYTGPITADSVRSSLLAFGKGKESTNRIIALDVDTLTYQRVETVGTPPSARYMHSACGIDDKIIIFGGCADMEYQNTNQQLYVFDTVTSTWCEQATSGTIPSSRHGHSATNIGNGRMLLFGGAYEFDKTLRYNDVYILDTHTWTWSQPSITGSPPLARAFHTAGLLESSTGERRLAVFAGETNQVSSDLVVLDIDTFRWSRPLFDGSFEHEMHSAIVVSDKLLIFGGLSYVSGLLDDFFFVNTVTISSGVTENDHTFKLVLVGDSAVGKSCLMTRFVEDRFSDIHLSTIGVDFKTVTTMIDGKIVKLHIWDTAGQERFAQVTTHYYRGADGAILVYDVTSPESFESIENWVEAVQNANGSTPVSLLLVGNKNDLVSQRRVTREQGQQCAEKIRAPFLECSAKDSSNVDVAFLNLAKKLVMERRARKRMASGGGGLRLDSQGGDGRRSCCK